MKSSKYSLTPEQIKSHIDTSRGDVIIDNKIYRPIDINISSKCCPKCAGKKIWKTGVEDIRKCKECFFYWGTDSKGNPIAIHTPKKVGMSFFRTFFYLITLGIFGEIEQQEKNTFLEEDDEDFNFDNMEAFNEQQTRNA